MRIPQQGKNHDLLHTFAGPGRCEHCSAKCPYGRDPAHVFARGLGDGHRIDHRLNLVSVCRTCHSASHNGQRPTQADLLAIVSAREEVEVAAIVEWIRLVQRLPKGSPVPELPGKCVRPEPESFECPF